jgi:hypothetical protein
VDCIELRLLPVNVQSKSNFSQSRTWQCASSAENVCLSSIPSAITLAAWRTFCLTIILPPEHQAEYGRPGNSRVRSVSLMDRKLCKILVNPENKVPWETCQLAKGVYQVPAIQQH